MVWTLNLSQKAECGLKPDFFGLDVDQAYGVPLEPQDLDVSVFDVFFAAGLLELGVEAHEVTGVWPVCCLVALPAGAFFGVMVTGNWRAEVR